MGSTPMDHGLPSLSTLQVDKVVDSDSSDCGSTLSMIPNVCTWLHGVWYIAYVGFLQLNVVFEINIVG